MDPKFDIKNFLAEYQDNEDFMKIPDQPFSSYEYHNKPLYIKPKEEDNIDRRLLGGYYLSKCGASLSKKEDKLCKNFKTAVLGFASLPKTIENENVNNNAPLTAPAPAASTAPPPESSASPPTESV